MGIKRNDSIELLRDLLMLGICILHSCSLGGFSTRWVCRLLMPCVPCFVFISGYYGIRTTPMRIAKLIGTAFACVPAIGIVSWFAGCHGIDGFVIGAKGVADNWFVWAYVGLMCFAPALNHALDSEKRLSLTLPIIGMSLGWGFIKGLPWFRTFMPTTDGLGGYTFTMMIGVYLVAGLWRRYEIACKARFWHWLIGFAGANVILRCIGLSAYCSPVSVVWAAILFTLFVRVRLDDTIGAVAAFVAKSTFPIFVMHANGIGIDLIRRLANLLCDEYGLSIYAMYLIVGITVFIAGLLLDMPRRGLVFQLARRNGK